MAHKKASRAERTAQVDIPISDIAAIKEKLVETFNSPTVFIGGRAVNLYCMNNSRGTHDIDLVINHKPSNIEYENLLRIQGDGKFGISHNPEVRGRIKIYYSSPSIATQVPGGKVTIDLFYPGYRSAFNKYQPKNTISGIPINFIIDTAETVRMGSLEFDVVAKPVLAVMKYRTWLVDRGKGNREGKDLKDIENLVRNYYNTSEDLNKLLISVKSIADQFLPKEDELFIVSGIMRNVNLDLINVDLRPYTNSLLRAEGLA